MSRPTGADPYDRVPFWRDSVELVELVRSGFREGVHRGAVVILDSRGKVLHALGNVQAPVFPRSSNKPAQAVGMLRCGLELSDPADVALAAASHAGEPDHLDRVSAMLHRCGLDENALRCPPDHPLSETARDARIGRGLGKRPIAMNCSGKHAAMLTTCVQHGWPTDTYLASGHPVQTSIADTLAELAGERVAATGVDGCGAPLLALSLTGLARMFAGVVNAADGSAEHRVADAMREHPFLVAGTGMVDTALMRAVPGLLSKSGAEGVAAIAVPGVGAAALKIDDGSARARDPVLAGALRALGVPASAVPADVSSGTLLGGGEPVGTVRLLPDVLA